MKDVDQRCSMTSPRMSDENIEVDGDEGMNRVVHCIQQYDSQVSKTSHSPLEGEIEMSTQGGSLKTTMLMTTEIMSPQNNKAVPI